LDLNLHVKTSWTHLDFFGLGLELDSISSTGPRAKFKASKGAPFTNYWCEIHQMPVCVVNCYDKHTEEKMYKNFKLNK